MSIGITREQCDEFSLRSQTLWKIAQDAGRFHITYGQYLSYTIYWVNIHVLCM